jgi:polysaccharide export outer membrane protein
MLEYRARVGDEFQFIFVVTREKSDEEYRLMVGDEILVESVSDESIKRGDFTNGIQIQTDGTVVLRLIGPIQAAGKTVPQLRIDVEKAYADYLKNPSIDITPIKTNTRLEDLRSAVSNFVGVNGGQNIFAVVNPDGRIQLPLIGSVYIVGMTMEEIKREVNLRYRERITGIELEPRLVRQASHFVYVFGEVTRPGRFEITQPTTVTQALAMAEGLKLGGNNRQVVVFRRAEDWRLVSTMLDLRGAHLGKRPNPADEIWLRDNDLIIVPPRPIKVFGDFVRQVFTEGAYELIPRGLIYAIPNGEGGG